MEAKEPLISVIIPIYNAEKYLKNCLDSILNQTFGDFELIAVDDGSADSSFLILKEYALKDKRIQIIKKRHSGVSKARNRGFKKAKGAYIIFLDADDFFENNFLFLLYQKAKNTGAEIVFCRHVVFDESKNKDILLKTDFETPKKIIFNYQDYPDSIFNFATIGVWCFLYRHDFLKKHHLKFLPWRYQEDAFFTKYAFLLAKKISFVDAFLVHYRYSLDSACRFQEKNWDSFIRYFLKFYKLLKKKHLEKMLYVSFIKHLYSFLYYYLHTLKEPYATKAFFKAQKKLVPFFLIQNTKLLKGYEKYYLWMIEKMKKI